MYFAFYSPEMTATSFKVCLFFDLTIVFYRLACPLHE